MTEGEGAAAEDKEGRKGRKGMKEANAGSKRTKAAVCIGAARLSSAACTPTTTAEEKNTAVFPTEATQLRFNGRRIVAGCLFTLLTHGHKRELQDRVSFN